MDQAMKGLPPEIEQKDAEARASAGQAVGQQAPMAEEPLDSGRVQGVTNALNAATKFLSDGQIATIELAENEDGEEQLPPELFAGLVAYQGGIDAAIQAGIEGADRYQIDATTAARSNSGLLEAEGVLKTAAKARDLKADLAGTPAKAPPAPPKGPESKKTPPKGPEKDNFDDLM